MIYYVDKDKLEYFTFGGTSSASFNFIIIENDNLSSSERPIEVNLNIDKFVNKSKEDINEIMDQIAFELRKRKLSYGGAR